MGAHEALKFLPPAARRDFFKKVFPILCDTIEQDRRLVFDPADGLYRGEESFLDWREQSYPVWTRDNVLPIAMSKALSTNVAHYFLLRTAADYSGMNNQPGLESKYAKWADDLKEAINRQFYEPKAGLYRAYLLSEDGGFEIPVERYELLGESLAILTGVADAERARSIINKYPAGPFGPPVVWPEERTEFIYHNQSIWPFVTAYWIKAAQKAGNAEAVDAGIQSLERLAALNLSNMENYDFMTGLSRVDTGPRKGPQINSRRQLWSAAGYLSMVQDVVFGLDTSMDGIRFRPFITAKMRNDIFKTGDAIELRELAYRGTRNLVRVHLPPAGSFARGICDVDRVELNGKPVGTGFVKVESLQPSNRWEIFLKAPNAGATHGGASILVADISNEHAVFGPDQPVWADDRKEIRIENGHAVLSYRHDDAANVSFNIYRNGELCATGVRETEWTDPARGDFANAEYSYAVVAVDLKSGNASHPTPSRSIRTPDQQQVIPATAMQHVGGNLVANHHFENWGKPEHEIVTNSFQVKHPGNYRVRVEFSNGAGPVNTGITCAVKRIEILRSSSKEIVASGYLVMPQSGDWNRWDLSSSVTANLDPDDHYVIRILEDKYSRNMSYLKNNERYTSGLGGGSEVYNFVNIADVRLLHVGNLSTSHKSSRTVAALVKRTNPKSGADPQ